MPTIQFGILMVPFQTLDVAGPLDILSCCSKDVVQDLESDGFPGAEGLTEKSIEIQFHHIGETMDPVTLSAGFTTIPTTTIDECPDLDYLLVGGPDTLTFKLSDAFADFLRKHVKAGRGLFTTCTGALAISPSGVLDGKMATTNHGVMNRARRLHPDVKWSVEKRFITDGNIWTAGGACAGMDMMAHWVMKNYDIRLAKLSFAALDYAPRDDQGNQVLPQ